MRLCVPLAGRSQRHDVAFVRRVWMPITRLELFGPRQRRRALACEELRARFGPQAALRAHELTLERQRARPPRAVPVAAGEQVIR